MPSVPFFMKKAHCFAEKITPAFRRQPGKEIVIMKKALLLTAAHRCARSRSHDVRMHGFYGTGHTQP